MPSNFKKRHIEPIAKRYGWLDYENKGYKYPIPDPFTGDALAWRYKDYDSNAAYKYYWIGGQPDNPLSNWYVPAPTLDAIEAAEGLCYLANGEPALLSFHAACVENAICTTLAETAVPKDAVSILHRFGITRLVYIVDNDYAGYKSGEKWTEALRGSGIDIAVYLWGNHHEDAVEPLKLADGTLKALAYVTASDVAHKADANDIWVQLNADSEAFKAHIANLQELHYTPLEVARPSKIDSDSFEETPQGLIDALSSALGVQAYKSNGWSSKKVLSPFRSEKRPSLTFNRLTGYAYDWGVDEWHHPIGTAKVLGIDWRRFFPQWERKHTQVQKQAVQEVYRAGQQALAERYDNDLYEIEALPGGYAQTGWLKQLHLPRAWLSALCNLTNGRSAAPSAFIRLHHAAYTGRINSYQFTRSDMMQALNNGKRLKSLDNALDWLLQEGFVSIVNTIDSSTLKAGVSTQKGVCGDNGRPACVYQFVRDTEAVSRIFASLMATYETEQAAKKALIQPTHTLRRDMRAMGLEDEDIQVYSKRVSAIGGTAKRLADARMVQWDSLLLDESTRYAAFDYDALSLLDSRSIRCALLKDALLQEGGRWQVANSHLAHLLGCDESQLSSYYADLYIKSTEVKDWYEISDIHGKTVVSMYQEAGSNTGGAVIGAVFKDLTGKWRGGIVYGLENWIAYAKEHKNRITGVSFRVVMPSILEFMSDEEISAYEQQRARETRETEAEQRSESETIDRPALSETVLYESRSNETDRKRTRKPSYSRQSERDWTRHAEAIIQEQLAVAAHCFTKAGVLPDNNLKMALQWLVNNMQTSAIRTVNSYYNLPEPMNLTQFHGIKISDAPAGRRVSKQVAKADKHMPTLKAQAEPEILATATAAPAMTLPAPKPYVPEAGNPYALSAVDYPKPRCTPESLAVAEQIGMIRNTKTHRESRYA